MQLKGGSGKLKVKNLTLKNGNGMLWFLSKSGILTKRRKWK